MDDHTLLGLELIERDESGNITAVITEGLGGGQVSVVVSFRISVEEKRGGKIITRCSGIGTALRLWPLTRRAGTGE